jgi:hypothetical protein
LAPEEDPMDKARSIDALSETAGGDPDTAAFARRPGSGATMTVCTHCGAPLPDLSEERQALIDTINLVNKQAIVPTIEADVFYRMNQIEQPMRNFRDISPNESIELYIELPRIEEIKSHGIVIKIRPTYSARRGQ